MNTADLELCEELYELSGWYDTSAYGYYTNDDHSDYAIQYPVNKEALPGRWWYEGINGWPAYDLGYLLRKLPKYIGHASQSCRFGLFPQGFTNTGSSDWCASYDTFKGEIYVLQTADTPEDAAAQLAIELFKKGILTPTKEQG